MRYILCIAATLGMAAALVLVSPPLQAQDIPANAMAELQRFQSLSAEEQQQLMTRAMEHAGKLHACIEESGGEEAVEELGLLYDAHSKQIDALCAAGKREQAQAYLDDVLTESESDPRIRKLRDCGLDALSSGREFLPLTQPEMRDEALRNICD